MPPNERKESRGDQSSPPDDTDCEAQDENQGDDEEETRTENSVAKTPTIAILPNNSPPSTMSNRSRRKAALTEDLASSRVGAHPVPGRDESVVPRSTFHALMETTGKERPTHGTLNAAIQNDPTQEENGDDPSPVEEASTVPAEDAMELSIADTALVTAAEVVEESSTEIRMKEARMEEEITQRILASAVEANVVSLPSVEAEEKSTPRRRMPLRVALFALVIVFIAIVVILILLLPKANKNDYNDQQQTTAQAVRRLCCSNSNTPLVRPFSPQSTAKIFKATMMRLNRKSSKSKNKDKVSTRSAVVVRLRVGGVAVPWCCHRHGRRLVASCRVIFVLLCREDSRFRPVQLRRWGTVK